MMSDAIETYLVDNLDVHQRTGDELILRECLVCGRAKKMYVNVVKGKFNCYSAHCEARGNLIGLIQLIEGDGSLAAVQKLKELMAGTFKTRPSSELKLMLDAALADTVDGGAEVEASIKVPLPIEMVDCFDAGRKPRWKIPPYLKAPKPEGRALTKDAIREWGIGYCPHGTYGGRIIVPVECDGMTSFVARSIEKYMKPKYLNPGHGLQSLVLFGYDRVVPRRQVIAVEGVFHAIRLWMYGYQAVAYFGSTISEAQAHLLARLQPSDLVWVPDADAMDKAINWLPRILPITGQLRMGSINLSGFTGDCDDADKDHIDYVVESAKDVEGTVDALAMRIARLRSPWD